MVDEAKERRAALRMVAFSRCKRPECQYSIHMPQRQKLCLPILATSLLMETSTSGKKFLMSSLAVSSCLWSWSMGAYIDETATVLMPCLRISAQIVPISFGSTLISACVL